MLSGLSDQAIGTAHRNNNNKGRGKTIPLKQMKITHACASGKENFLMQVIAA